MYNSKIKYHKATIAFFLLFALQLAANQTAQAQKDISQYKNVAVAHSPKNRSTFDSVARSINQIKGFTTAKIGIHVTDLNSNETLTSLNATYSLVPASNLKIITTATALEIMSDTARFKTLVAYSGTIDTAGILNGNIYIVGGGDPSLGSQYFDTLLNNRDYFLNQWCDAVAKAGIRKINGRIIADVGAFKGDIPASWTWEDIGNYYGAAACGLSVFDNTFNLVLASENKTGGKVDIKDVYPFVPELKIENQLIAATGDASAIYGSPLDGKRILKGTIPRGRASYTIQGSIPDPAYLLANALESRLFQKGIATLYGSSTISRMKSAKIEVPNRNEKRKIIHVINSPELKHIVKVTNVYSMNLYAEHLFKHLAYRFSGEGNTDSGEVAIKSFWQTKGINTDGMSLMDGSGLSHQNTITPKQMTEILAYMRTKSQYKNTFYESLPIAGVSGTLKGLCKGSLAEGNIRAKSGYIRHVRGYSGYVTTKSKRNLVFSMIFNDYTCSTALATKQLEQLMIHLANIED